MARGGYSGSVVLGLCVLSFLLGSFLSSLRRLPEADRGLAVREGFAARDKILLEADNSSGDRSGGGSGDALVTGEAEVKCGVRPLAQQHYSSFEELLADSGMLAGKPPLETGESGHPFYTVQPFQLLSWYPRAYLLPNFLDEEKARHIIALAERRMRPSQLAFKKGDTAENTRNIRTSDGTFLSREDDPEGVLAFVEDKIAAVVGIPVGHGEAFNVLRYVNGQHYDSHSDAFEEESYGKQPNQRIATVLLYLSTPEEGGETVFLLEGKQGLERLWNIDYKACNTGIKVQPRVGDALLFWSLHPNGTIDRHALHGACPTTKGTKWALTKWLRANCMRREFC